MESYFVLSTDQMSGLSLVSSLYTDSVLTPDQQITETDTSNEQWAARPDVMG